MPSISDKFFLFRGGVKKSAGKMIDLKIIINFFFYDFYYLVTKYLIVINYDLVSEKKMNN